MSNSIIDDISNYYRMKKVSESIPKIQSPDYVEVDLNKIIGKEYEPFWYSRERYRVVKGSRGSKKSKVTALFYISMMEKYDMANLVVIRKHLNTHRTSTRNDLIWAIHRLGLDNNW